MLDKLFRGNKIATLIDICVARVQSYCHSRIYATIPYWTIFPIFYSIVFQDRVFKIKKDYIYLCFCFMGCFWENSMGKFCSTIFIHLSKTDFVQITRRLCLFFSDISESLIWSRGFFPNGILGNFLNISVRFVRGQKKVPLKVEFNYMEIFHKSDGFYITTTTVELRNKNVNFQFFPPTTKFEMVH